MWKSYNLEKVKSRCICFFYRLDTLKLRLALEWCGFISFGFIYISNSTFPQVMTKPAKTDPSQFGQKSRNWLTFSLIYATWGEAG
jgi:hypothetical protein